MIRLHEPVTTFSRCSMITMEMPRAAMARIEIERLLDFRCVQAGVDLVEHQDMWVHGQALGELQTLAIGQRPLLTRACRPALQGR